MFQVVLLNRVMEHRELELPASGDKIQEAYDQLKESSRERSRTVVCRKDHGTGRKTYRNRKQPGREM